jgi:hypothetical protein
MKEKWIIVILANLLILSTAVIIVVAFVLVYRLFFPGPVDLTVGLESQLPIFILCGWPALLGVAGLIVLMGLDFALLLTHVINRHRDRAGAQDL